MYQYIYIYIYIFNISTIIELHSFTGSPSYHQGIKLTFKRKNTSALSNSMLLRQWNHLETIKSRLSCSSMYFKEVLQSECCTLEFKKKKIYKIRQLNLKKCIILDEAFPLSMESFSSPFKTITEKVIHFH